MRNGLKPWRFRSSRIEAVGAQLRFLPRYGPDFNPIELAFAKLKALRCGAAPDL
jgi:transposase